MNAGAAQAWVHRGHDPADDAIRPLAIAFSAGLLGVSLRCFFYGPAIVTGIATACFTIATVLST